MGVFDSAWEIVKADYRLGQMPIINHHTNPINFRLLGNLARNRGNMDKLHHREITADMAEQMMRDILLDQTTVANLGENLTDAKTPRLFRSMPEDEFRGLEAGSPHPKRYFSPQRLVPLYYSDFWNSEPRDIGHFEMPVPFDDDSVLDLGGDDEFRGRGVIGHESDGKMVDGDSDSPVVQRLAEGSGVTPEEARRIASYWEMAYHGSPAFGIGSKAQQEFNDLMRNAGYDYILHNEMASQELSPPIWEKFRAKASGLRGGEKYEPLENLRSNLADLLGGPQKYKSAWHIGDEDSAPIFTGDTEAPFYLRRGNSGNLARYSQEDLRRLLFAGHSDDIYDSIYGEPDEMWWR